MKKYRAFITKDYVGIRSKVEYDFIAENEKMAVKIALEYVKSINEDEEYRLRSNLPWERIKSQSFYYLNSLAEVREIPKTVFVEMLREICLNCSK